jgi:large subunit ribosomal protein L10
MRKEEKLDIINAIAAQLEETPNFYIADIAGLNAGKTHQLRKACFEAGVKLVVVKNTLLTKVLEQGENEEAKNLIPVLAGPTAVLFTETPNAPAKVIKSFKEKGNEKPVLKGAFIQEWPAFIGEDKLDALYGIRSREELIGDIIGLLQSPIRNVLSALEHKDDEKNEEAAAE